MAVFLIPVDRVTKLFIETSPFYCQRFLVRHVRHTFKGVQDNDEVDKIISGFKSPAVPVIFVLGQYVECIVHRQCSLIIVQFSYK